MTGGAGERSKDPPPPKKTFRQGYRTHQPLWVDIKKITMGDRSSKRVWADGLSGPINVSQPTSVRFDRCRVAVQLESSFLNFGQRV